LVVHFLGHGGRYVWRTGPPDYHDSSDLFSSVDLEALPANRRLPLVLSMTCSSGPFDHPTADSLAETFLRLPDRGAIGVLAASWRIAASEQLSQALIRELTTQNAAIGEAVMKAKNEVNIRGLAESYNLLGDPAMQLSQPDTDLTLEVRSSDGVITVTADVTPDRFPDGQAIIYWLDSTGQKLKTQQSILGSGPLEFHYPLSVDNGPPSMASVYVWSTVSGRDASGEISMHKLARTP